MQKHPYVEFCASGENFSWLRLNGKVVFSKDLGLKARIQDASPIVKSIYKTPDNPTFEVFYLDGAVGDHRRFQRQPTANVQTLTQRDELQERQGIFKSRPVAGEPPGSSVHLYLNNLLFLGDQP